MPSAIYKYVFAAVFAPYKTFWILAPSVFDRFHLAANDSKLSKDEIVEYFLEIAKFGDIRCCTPNGDVKTLVYENESLEEILIKDDFNN